MKYNRVITEHIVRFLSITTILIGIFLRLKVYLYNRPFWHDECSLASNILLKDYGSFWGVLDLLQSAPPLFMIASKFLFNVFSNTPELALRFIPLISSIVALILFYLLLNKIFNNKFLVLIGTLLLSFNFQLIYYAQEFKQYSSDVLLIIFSIFIFNKLNIQKIRSLKEKIFLAVILLILPFISLPTIFVIAAFLTLNFIHFKKKRLEIILISLPMLIANTLYYFLTLKPAKEIMLGTLSDIWTPGFLSINAYSNINLLLNKFTFTFTNCKFAIIPLILFFIGTYIAYKRKENTSKFLILTILFVGLASFLHIYPIKERVSLYLIPILIIFVLYSLNIDLMKNKLYSVLLILTTSIFLSNFNFKYIEHIPNNPIFTRKDPRSTMQELIKHYNKGELIIYNDASLSELMFYGHYYNFLNKNTKLAQINLSSYGEDWYYNVLNTIPKNNRYWFYYPYDYVNKPVIQFLKKWINNNAKILYEYEKNSSYLVQIQT